jgi:hypothetical protein
VNSYFRPNANTPSGLWCSVAGLEGLGKRVTTLRARGKRIFRKWLEGKHLPREKRAVLKKLIALRNFAHWKTGRLEDGNQSSAHPAHGVLQGP